MCGPRPSTRRATSPGHARCRSPSCAASCARCPRTPTWWPTAAAPTACTPTRRSGNWPATVSGRGGWPGCPWPPGTPGEDDEGRSAVTATVVVPVVDEGLGNSAYLMDLGDGRALAVDVPRDLRAVRAAAGRHGLAVAFAADTHLHADFLSGAPQLAAEDGAQILASAAGRRAFGHRALADC